jgi:hypothetical protein
MAGAAGYGYQLSIKSQYLGDSPTRECCPVEQLKSLSFELQAKHCLEASSEDTDDLRERCEATSQSGC